MPLIPAHGPITTNAPALPSPKLSRNPELPHIQVALLALSAGLLLVVARSAATSDLCKIFTIIVISQQNRRCDDLYGRSPGASSLSKCAQKRDPATQSVPPHLRVLRHELTALALRVSRLVPYLYGPYVGLQNDHAAVTPQHRSG
jgi:hypothetical protein